MADITKCVNETCPLKKVCYRQTAPDSRWQSRALYTYDEKTGCPNYYHAGDKRPWYNVLYGEHPDVAAILSQAPGHVCDRIDEKIRLLGDTPEDWHTVAALEDARDWLTDMRQAMLDMADLLCDKKPKRELASDHTTAKRKAKANSVRRKLATLPPEHPLAPDELRLAAGWMQQTEEELDSNDLAWRESWEPVFGPPGEWRLHVSGKLVRWVRGTS